MSSRHPDRLFPSDPGLRQVARHLYSLVADAPIFSAHGHVEAEVLLDDEPFSDAATLLVTSDHYVTRLLHSIGIPLEALGLGENGAATDRKAIWRALCDNWHIFLGTPSRYWLEGELSTFGIDEPLTHDNADATFDLITAQLAEPQFRPRALFARFGIEAIATTDDPLSDLAAHRTLNEDAGFAGSLVPNFRPDRYVDPGESTWVSRLGMLADATGLDTADYAQFLDALRARRAHFVANGATATDHAMMDVGTEPLSDSDAAALHARALAGGLDAASATAYRRNMTFQMARMSTEDGLVMQLHPGVVRDHHRPTADEFGSDTGHDIPVPVSFTTGLRPLLEEFGNDPRFRMVLYTVDETTFSREIAPLAGFYPSVYMGVPWWFLDAPDAIARFRSAVTETAGFYKNAGFVDDTRAFCSIPERHDMSRRADSSYLARLVGENRMSESDAAKVIHDLVVTLPRRVFARTV
ncbi:MAG: Glucuronate isomerase [Rhodoglobus sp.]|nr:Glucuronate isomerase [Rhodoglobus sp.]